MQAMLGHDGSLLFFCDYWEAEEYRSRRPDRPPRYGPIPVEGRGAACVYCSACAKRIADGWNCLECGAVPCPDVDWSRTAVAAEVAQAVQQRQAARQMSAEQAETLSEADPDLTGEEIVDLLLRDATRAGRSR